MLSTACSATEAARRGSSVVPMFRVVAVLLALGSIGHDHRRVRDRG